MSTVKCFQSHSVIWVFEYNLVVGLLQQKVTELKTSLNATWTIVFYQWAREKRE